MRPTTARRLTLIGLAIALAIISAPAAASANGTTKADGTVFTGYEAAFVDTNGHLRTVPPLPVVQDSGQLVSAGSSVSTSSRPDGLPSVVYPDATAGNQLTFDINNQFFAPFMTGDSPVNPVDPGTSPAFASDSSGDIGIAFAHDGLARYWLNDADRLITLGRILPNTSPSMATFTTGGAIIVWVDELGHIGYNLRDSGITVSNFTVPQGVSPAVATSGSLWRIMVPDTEGHLYEISNASPFTGQRTLYTIRGSASLSGLAGGFATSFVDRNDNRLWVNGLQTDQVVQPGNDPAIAGDGGTGWRVIFQAASNQHAMTFDSGGNVRDLKVVMSNTHNPAITALFKTPGTTPPAPPAMTTVPLSLNKQPTVNGNIPYLGLYPPFGSVPPGKLQSITLLAAGHAGMSLLLVKRGFGTADCANANAVVVVNPGHTTTPAELSAIYGTDKPPYSSTSQLPVLACLSLVQSPGTPAPTFVQVQLTVQSDN